MHYVWIHRITEFMYSEKPYTVIPLLLKPCQSINRLGTFQNSLPFEIINILKSLHNSFAIWM